MRSKVTTAPTVEPVSLAELKLHLRITSNEEDSILNEFISVSRQIAEDFTGRKFINQTLTAYDDGFFNGSFYGEWWDGVKVGTYETHVLKGSGSICLDWGPASSITSIHTIDDDGTETLYPSSNYYLDNFDEDLHQKVYLVRNADLPTSIRSENGLKIVYVAGYGSTALSVPAKLKHAIKMMSAYIYENRGDCDDCEVKSGQKGLLESYKIVRV